MKKITKYTIIKKVKCPKCGMKNPDLLDYYEGHTVAFCYEDGKYNEGLLEPGNVTKVIGECNKCKYIWRIRNAIHAGHLIDLD